MFIKIFLIQIFKFTTLKHFLNFNAFSKTFDIIVVYKIQRTHSQHSIKGPLFYDSPFYTSVHLGFYVFLTYQFEFVIRIRILYFDNFINIYTGKKD
ncbi:hypothetical protein B1J93_00510 [Leptospira kirschneri serovar Pomona]|uniref:Uncharacterized protein n=1 Tax=Leptospira kirschneri serovar Pomona TaxID=561005 RepID=A0A1T1E4J8_9LEPT|nr:hypothetical protein B1J93_00510 [Leptospira kirschneri serovar Pomona]